MSDEDVVRMRRSREANAADRRAMDSFIESASGGGGRGRRQEEEAGGRGGRRRRRSPVTSGQRPPNLNL